MLCNYVCGCEHISWYYRLYLDLIVGWHLKWGPTNEASRFWGGLKERLNLMYWKPIPLWNLSKYKWVWEGHVIIGLTCVIHGFYTFTIHTRGEGQCFPQSAVIWKKNMVKLHLLTTFKVYTFHYLNIIIMRKSLLWLLTRKIWQQIWLLFKTTIPLNIFLFDMNFDKFIIELHFLLIRFMLAKFSKYQKSMIMLSIKYLDFKKNCLKLCIKNKFMD